MILGLILDVEWLRAVLAKSGFLNLYAVCLEVSARGYFYAWAVCAVLSLPLGGFKLVLDFLDAHLAGLGFIEIATPIIAMIFAPLGGLIAIIALDCVTAGLRARNQFLLGSLLSSNGHDERLHQLLEKLGEARSV